MWKIFVLRNCLSNTTISQLVLRATFHYWGKRFNTTISLPVQQCSTTDEIYMHNWQIVSTTESQGKYQWSSSLLCRGLWAPRSVWRCIKTWSSVQWINHLLRHYWILILEYYTYVSCVIYVKEAWKSINLRKRNWNWSRPPALVKIPAEHLRNMAIAMFSAYIVNCFSLFPSHSVVFKAGIMTWKAFVLEST
jgi:hypothetical protein